MIHDTRMLEYYIIWNVRVRSDFMLPRVDGGYTWINYGIYTSVLHFLLENWRKKASRWSAFSFSSSLLNKWMDIPWYIFFLFTSSVLRGTSTPSWSPCPRFEPTLRTKRSIHVFASMEPGFRTLLMIRRAINRDRVENMSITAGT